MGGGATGPREPPLPILSGHSANPSKLVEESFKPADNSSRRNLPTPLSMPGRRVLIAKFDHPGGKRADAKERPAKGSHVRLLDAEVLHGGPTEKGGRPWSLGYVLGKLLQRAECIRPGAPREVPPRCSKVFAYVGPRCAHSLTVPDANGRVHFDASHLGFSEMSPFDPLRTLASQVSREAAAPLLGPCRNRSSCKLRLGQKYIFHRQARSRRAQCILAGYPNLAHVGAETKTMLS